MIWRSIPKRSRSYLSLDPKFRLEHLFTLSLPARSHLAKHLSKADTASERSADSWTVEESLLNVLAEVDVRLEQMSSPFDGSLVKKGLGKL